MNSQDTFYLAPIRKVTDSVFRTVFTKHFGGADKSIAPFLRTAGNSLKEAGTADLALSRNAALPVVPQVLTRNPDAFLDAANRFADTGYACINWNIACPMPTSTRKGLGAALLDSPGQVDQFLGRVCGEAPINVSIKMRIGFNDIGRLDEVLDALNRHRLDEVVIHPRTGAQLYRGSVDLDAFEKCTKKLVHPIVYSGDITDVGSYTMLKQRFPEITSWMLGRAVAANPMIFRQIITGDCSLRATPEQLTEFCRDLYSEYCTRLNGWSHVATRMAGIFESIDEPAFKKSVSRRLKRVKSLAEFELLAESFYNRLQLNE